MKKTFTFIPLTALITTLLTTPANACAIGSGELLTAEALSVSSLKTIPKYYLY
jgi:hypothetical protein